MILLNRIALAAMAIDSIGADRWPRLRRNLGARPGLHAEVAGGGGPTGSLPSMSLPHDCAFTLRHFDNMLANPVEVDKQFKMRAAFGRMFRFDEKETDIGWWGKLNERYPRFLLLKSKIDSLERMAAVQQLRSLRRVSLDTRPAERLEREFGPPAADGTQRRPMWDVDGRRKMPSVPEQRIQGAPPGAPRKSPSPRNDIASSSAAGRRPRPSS